MMTPEQRYLFDVTGYLHLENAIQGEELKAAQVAADTYINTPTEELPDGFDSSGKHLPNGFAFSRALEALALHPASWQIIRELTDNKPQLARGTMIADRIGVPEGGDALRLHCAREDYGRDRNCFENRNGTIYCDDFVVFPYLTDVYPGDGGLLIVPGSHKAEYDRPKHIFNNGTIDDVDNIPLGVENITPKAGDILIIFRTFNARCVTLETDRPVSLLPRLTLQTPRQRRKPRANRGKRTFSTRNIGTHLPR